MSGRPRRPAAERVPAVRLARLDLRADRAGTGALAILVAITTLLATATPVVFTQAADAALPAMMAAAPPLNRDVALTLEARFEPEPGAPLGAATRYGQTLQDTLPASLRGLVIGRVGSATTVKLAAPGLDRRDPGFEAGLKLRAQDGIDDEVAYLRGRAPAPAGSSPLEVAVSSETATALGQDLGATIPLTSPWGEPLEVEIIGIFEPRDPAADYWADSALVQPVVVNEGDGDLVKVSATVLISAEDYPVVFQTVGDAMTYGWRFLMDWHRVDAEGRQDLAADVAGLRARYPFRGSTSGSDAPSLSTGIGAIIDRYFVERSAAEAAMALALIGPAAAVVGALGMIAATIANRRRPASLLARARGATDRQVVTSRLLVASTIVLPTVLLPAVVVGALAGAASVAGVAATAAAVALLAIGLVGAITIRSLRGAGDGLRQGRPAVWWGGPRSLVRDGLIVAITVAGVVWIGQRGATVATGGGLGPGSTVVGVDPLLLLVPVLVALAGGLIAWRCYLPLVRAGAAMAAAHPGFVPVHAMRGPSRGAGGLQVPLVVLVVTIAVGVFSAIVVLSLQRQQAAVSMLTVGADYRVESATRDSLPVQMTLPAEAEATADVVIRDGILTGGTVRSMAIAAAAIDGDAYRRVVAGTPADGFLPAALTASTWDPSSGTSPETALPAVLVGEGARRPALTVGDAFEMAGLGRAKHFRVVAILPEFPGATSPRGTVLVPLAGVTAADPDRPFFRTQVFVRGGPDLGDAMREATVGSYGAPNVTLVSRADVRAAMDRDPLVRDTSVGFMLAMLVSLGFAALVVAVAVFRDVAARGDEIALLRALGSRPRQILGVIVIEQGTVVLTAVTGGLVLGCLMGVLAVPSLGLDRFVRPGDIVEAAIEWPVISGVAVGQALVALLAMILATLVARRRDPVPAMMRDA